MGQDGALIKSKRLQRRFGPIEFLGLCQSRCAKLIPQGSVRSQKV
jgi:hypothetical protein